MSLIGVLLILILAVIIVFFVVSLFQWLWNITMPELFKLPFVSFWQAFRLLLLASLLFGSTRIGGFSF